ncbi:MAG: hypothetical protein IPO92_19110 [Saprospiraceae bacterium]|nr:hypothetical protein [Saprospiraceae bacterium]
MVNPSLSKEDTFSPSPLITSLNVNNNPFMSDMTPPYLDSIILSHDKNFISIEFQTPNFSQSENIVYKYMLTGVDSSWVKSGSRNFVGYTQLKPGSYTFLVQSANNNKIWCKKPRSLFIKILPPWYKTNVFILLTSICLFLLSYLFVNDRIKTFKANEKLKKAKVSSRNAGASIADEPAFYIQFTK